MVICFDATTEAKRSLDALIATGQFKDTSDAISIALTSYEAIQRGMARGTQPTVECAPTERPEKSQPVEATESSIRTLKASALGPQIPELLFLNTATANGIKLADVPPVKDASTNPPAKWLFGQYNKFLPVKVSSRALLNLLRQKPAGVILSEAVETISQAAWEFGDYLNILDERTKRSREDSFAAAFPVSAGNGAVSRIRFANQFVGDLRQPKQAEGQPKETKFNGLPSALKFFFCADGKSPLVTLTTAGAEFALLRNPILDSAKDEIAQQKFSEAEVSFLLAHIRNHVPEETAAYLSIIDAIQAEANNPDEVDKFLCERFNLRIAAKTETENDITQTFLTTQRTGAISRMVDLGLLTRQKEGLRVTYSITNQAKAFRGQ